MGVCKFTRRTFKIKMAMGAIWSEEEVTKDCDGKIELKYFSEQYFPKTGGFKDARKDKGWVGT